MKQTTELEAFKQNMDQQLVNPEIKKALIETTFKGLDEINMRKAILEGGIRGFNFKDFLEKNVYAVKYGPSYSLVTSIDYNRKIGAKSGVCGVEEPTYETKIEGEKEKIISCSVTVKKLVQGHVGDFTAKVYFDEYYKPGKTWDGKYTPSMWDQKPRTMIAKVAEMHALRKACPEELAQSYIEEELQKENKPIEVPNSQPASEKGKIFFLLKEKLGMDISTKEKAVEAIKTLTGLDATDENMTAIREALEAKITKNDNA